MIFYRENINGIGDWRRLLWIAPHPTRHVLRIDFIAGHFFEKLL